MELSGRKKVIRREGPCLHWICTCYFPYEKSQNGPRFRAQIFRILCSTVTHKRMSIGWQYFRCLY